MSDFEFPDVADVPTINYDPEDPYEFQSTKTLFLRYDSEQWEDEDIMEVVTTFNALFDQKVQLVVMKESLEFMDPEEVREVLNDVLESVDDE